MKTGYNSVLRVGKSKIGKVADKCFVFPSEHYTANIAYYQDSVKVNITRGIYSRQIIKVFFNLMLLIWF